MENPPPLLPAGICEMADRGQTARNARAADCVGVEADSGVLRATSLIAALHLMNSIKKTGSGLLCCDPLTVRPWGAANLKTYYFYMISSKSPRRVMLAAFDLATDALPEFSSKFSRRDFTRPQLFACLVLKEFWKGDY